MPIYEYKCQDCGHVEEHLMKLSDPPPRHCVKCEGSQLEKLMSQTSFALKGSGWYVTDYKAKAGGKADAETPSTPATGEASEGAKPTGAGETAAPAASAPAGGTAAATPGSAAASAPAVPAAAKSKVSSGAE